jgi:hypothetical protein
MKYKIKKEFLDREIEEKRNQIERHTNHNQKVVLDIASLFAYTMISADFQINDDIYNKLPDFCKEQFELIN